MDVGPAAAVNLQKFNLLPMGLYQRIVRGDPLRKTRLHNYHGERIDLAGLRYLPVCLWSTVWFKLTGQRSAHPWLGYRAVRRIESVLRPGWSVLEFGSGASSLWLARRCARLLAIENEPAWHATTVRLLRQANMTHAECRLLPHDIDWALPDIAERSFDFALVDGYHRSEEMAAALRKVRPGGWVYLDNCDCHHNVDYSEARRMLVAAAAKPPEYFTDFAPLEFRVTQGVLVQV
jgi:hypothetical protein